MTTHETGTARFTGAERARRVDRYFVKPPGPPDRWGTLALVLLGAVALPWSVFTLSGGLPVLGAYLLVLLVGLAGALCLAGGFLKALADERGYRDALLDALPRATDAEMDDWLDEAVARAITEGRRGLDARPGDSVTVWFTGVPDFETWEVSTARGADGVLRFSIHPVLVVHLRGRGLSTYECVYSMRGDVFLNEVRKEYHLRPSDGMEVATDRVMLPLRLTDHAAGDQELPDIRMVTMTSRQELVLMVSGRTVRLTTTFDLDDRRHDEGAPRSRNDEFVAVLRDWFREHLGGEPVARTVPAPAIGATPAPAAVTAQGAGTAPDVAAGARGVLLTVSGPQTPLADRPSAETAALYGSRDLDDPGALWLEANAVALMEARGVTVASLVVLGREPAREDELEHFAGMLSAGSQLHLFEGETYRRSVFGAAVPPAPGTGGAAGEDAV